MLYIRFIRQKKCKFLFNDRIELFMDYRISIVIAILLAISPVIHSIDFEDYDEDVAALLREYQNQSNPDQSYTPSILSYSTAKTSKTIVDFERGIIYMNASTPETLRDAIIDVVLTQIDPSVIDAQTAIDFGLINEETNKPFFWGQVLDHKGKPISSRRPALDFANFLLRKKTFSDGRFEVTIRMIDAHKKIAGAKYVSFVKAACLEYSVSSSLVMAIMETESSFNPLARSRSNALGLMQVKANTAGRDYFSLIKGYKHTPSSKFLYSPKNNIEVATGYLNILSSRYLRGIEDPKKLEYAMISSYNGGAGNLWKSLDKSGNKTKALKRINQMSTKQFYWFLTNRHIRQETREYLKKVNDRKSKYTLI
tara:strand:- start:60 stop:1160 length:1101 start_codon:yes stop_codon:yes gene_type:complete